MRVTWFKLKATGLGETNFMHDGGLMFLGAGHNFTEHHWRVSHAHSAQELVIITAGCERVSIEGEQFDAPEGCVIYFPGGKRHTEVSVGPKPAENLVLQFRCDWDTSSWPRCCLDIRGRLRMLVTWMFESREMRQPEERAANQALLQAFLHEYVLLIHHQEDERVQTIRRYIEENIAAVITVEQLAQQLGMSKYHFIRLYKKLTGLTPMAEVRNLRANRARDLILADRLALKEIAVATGLGNLMALCRLCRRQFQMAPAQIRQSAHAHNKRCEP